MTDFKSYLATQIVAEKQTISYRNVARALRVHVNSAKCMLYEFWEKENKKKSGSVYATYLVAGTKHPKLKPALTNGNTKHHDEDEPMHSSPPPFTSSMMEPSQASNHVEERDTVPIKCITLVREEDLEATKSQYGDITSIHIYSLSPGRLQDLVVLTDISRGLYLESFVKEDPLTNNKTYGIIQNPGVRRRKGKRAVIPDAPAPRFQPTKSEKNTQAEASKPVPSLSKQNTTETSGQGSRESSVSTSSTKQPTLKRDGSNLFKAFAKAQKQPKMERKDTDASTNASASGAEDTKMADADEEGESEDDAIFLDTGTSKTKSKKRPSEVKKEREDKQAKLRKMMESDDEDEKAIPNVEEASGATEEPPAAKNGDDPADTAGDAGDDVAWSDSDTEKAQQKPPPKNTSTNNHTEQTTTEPKRRRGKRKTMKKRTMKDEDGYLVTKEEAVWESYSEDEPEPPKDKPKSAFSSMKNQSAPSSQKSSAGTKGGTQKKKGDIMSFFGKK